MHWLESPYCVSAEPSLPGADDTDMTQLYSQQKLDYAIFGGERRRGNMWYVACCGNQAISAGGMATSDVLYNDCPNLARCFSDLSPVDSCYGLHKCDDDFSAQRGQASAAAEKPTLLQNTRPLKWLICKEMFSS